MGGGWGWGGGHIVGPLFTLRCLLCYLQVNMGGVWACLCLCFKQPGLLWLHTLARARHTGESVLTCGSLLASFSNKKGKPAAGDLRWKTNTFAQAQISFLGDCFWYFSSPSPSILDCRHDSETAQGARGGIILCWGSEWKKKKKTGRLCPRPHDVPNFHAIWLCGSSSAVVAFFYKMSVRQSEV